VSDAEVLRRVLAAQPARPNEFVCPYCFDQGPAPVPVPLTDEQIIAVRKAVPLFTSGLPWENSLAFARAIEHAHGIAASPEVPGHG